MDIVDLVGSSSTSCLLRLGTVEPITTVLLTTKSVDDSMHMVGSDFNLVYSGIYEIDGAAVQ